MSEKTKSTQTQSAAKDNSRMLSIIAVGLALLMVLLIALVFWRMISFGRDAATAYSSDKKTTASATPSATGASENPDAKKSPEMTLAQAREKLSLLTDNSLCQGEADAEFLIEFTNLAEEAGQWEKYKNEVNARLKELPEKCGETYAANLANRLRSASTPANLSALIDKTLSQAGGDKRPAPNGAIDMGNFSAPSSNIQCAFDQGKVSCTINQYDYVSATCQGSPATYSIASDGTTSQSCAPVSAENVVAYGTTVARDGLACTVTQEGVECWDEASGKGFKLSRSAISTF